MIRGLMNTPFLNAALTLHALAVMHRSSIERNAMTGRNEVRERMEVVDSGGKHVGFVEAVEAGEIRLMRDAPEKDAPHHVVPLAWVEHVGQTVRLDRDCDEVRRTWERNRCDGDGGTGI